jgi:hypothetical protein
LQPKALRFRRARRFQQHGKLQRLGVLRLIENHAKVFFANPLRDDRMLQQLFRERDLVTVRDESAVESKIEIIALHFRRHAGRRVAYPFSKRRKFLLPELSEPGVCRCETDRPAQVFPIAGVTCLPFPQFRLRFADVVAARLIDLLMDLGEIQGRTLRESWHLQNSRSRASRQFHEIPSLYEAQKRRAVFFAQRTTDARLILRKLLPEIVVVFD